MEFETEHILMLPFMAQGHLRPFLQLAHRLHSRTRTRTRKSTTNITITILTTPLNAQFLRQQLLPSATTTITIAELPFNSSDHGLPPGVDNTEKLPLFLIPTLYSASTSLEPHLRHFISLHFPHRPPLCIIFDVFLGWADRVARSVGSTGVAFTTCGAYGTAVYASIWNELPHLNLSNDEDDFQVPCFPETHRYRRSDLHYLLKIADGSDQLSRFIRPQIRYSLGSSGWLCNSVEEAEPLGFEALRICVKLLPVWPIGPLIYESNSNDDECILHWLNSHKPDSVLYISFGSQNTISPTQMMEFAAGLELSGKPFVWVIRPPFGFDINGEFRPEWLPEGFEDRVKKKQRGVLVHKWGPQLKILRHESTAAFVTHCGWNSVLEGLTQGLPMIGWPLAGEQPYNSKMLVEQMAVAVELTRGVEGKVSKEDVKRVVDLVMEREEGSFGWEMKKKAVEMRKKLNDAVKENRDCKGSSVKALDDFLDAIITARST